MYEPRPDITFNITYDSEKIQFQTGKFYSSERNNKKCFMHTRWILNPTEKEVHTSI